MICGMIVALLKIAHLAETDRDFTGLERFPFYYERSRMIFIPPVPVVTRKWANRTEVAKSGHYDIRLIYYEEFADCRMFRYIAKRAWQ